MSPIFGHMIWARHNFKLNWNCRKSASGFWIFQTYKILCLRMYWNFCTLMEFMILRVTLMRMIPFEILTGQQKLNESSFYSVMTTKQYFKYHTYYDLIHTNRTIWNRFHIISHHQEFIRIDEMNEGHIFAVSDAELDRKL